MPRSAPLSDREMFGARPWRAADRSQVIVAVVERAPAGEAGPAWHVVLATLQGAPLYARRLAGERTSASFTNAELQALYDEARAQEGAASPWHP